MQEHRIWVKRRDGIKTSVRYNQNLDTWDGRDYSYQGHTGEHRGITTTEAGEYVLISGSDKERDTAQIITEEQALKIILHAGALQLLETKKFKKLKKLYEEMEEKPNGI